MSRPGKGVEHVESLEGDASTKARLRTVLETITEAISVEEACERLGVSPARFHELRREALEGAMKALEPRAPGRPPLPRPDPEVEALRATNHEHTRALEAANIRADIAIAMPRLLRPLPEEKKGSPPKPTGRSGT